MKQVSFMSEKNNFAHFIIRDFKSDDYEQINLLWKETGLGGSQRDDNLQVINSTLANGGKLIILEHSAQNLIIGTAWLTTDTRRIYLHHFCVKPTYQNKGISHLLCNESIKFAKEKKMQIKLEVHKDNLIATELYKKHGFTYLGDYDVYIIRDLSIIDKVEL